MSLDRQPKRPIAGLLTAIMSSCGDAIIACSADGRINEWSNSARDAYGYTPQEAIGKRLDLIVPPDRSAEIDRIIKASESDEATPPFETVRMRRWGETFPASVSAFPLCDDEGDYAGFVVMEREVSNLFKSAEVLRKALKRAEEANSAKSRFLANASHELRTPMNAIVCLTALALEEKISPELRDYLETIRDSSDAMLHLINDVLDLSKFESERFELNDTPFDPRDLVENTIKVIGAAANAKGLELICQIDPETPLAVVGDPVRLRQVLTNLVGNAVKFTATGQVIVEVTPQEVESNRCKLRFRVIDSGIGISEEDQARIFTPFTQVDGATTRRYRGTGLGLTITQHLIDCFGGELRVESTPGEGSCFSFELPFVISREVDEEEYRAAADQLRGLTVLVVDDNEASREALVRQFKAWEMIPTAVGSGQEALDLLKASCKDCGHFNLAVIDALMPGIDGFSVSARIEADSEIKAKPILMASSTDRLEFSRRCAEAGAAAFVQKPISQSQLLGAVVQASGASSIAGESRPGLFDSALSVSRRVLLVEDTPANRKVVERVLTKRGHQIDIAVNGREAVDSFRHGVYDLILMDVQMPIMDGFQATEAIRQIERKADSPTAVPIIALTAHSMRGDRERCLRAGMDGYLSKPLDLQGLIRIVEKKHRPHSQNGVQVAEATRSEATKPNTMSPTKIDAITWQPTMQNNHQDNHFVDMDAALQRLRGDRSLLIEMINFYEEDAPVLLETVQTSHQSGKLETLQRAAHSLKGLGSTFDAHAMTATALDVEIAAKEGHQEKLPALIEQLKAETSRLNGCLASYRKEYSKD